MSNWHIGCANTPTTHVMSPAAEREWYVLYTKPQKEDYARFHLSAKGLDVFFPQLWFPHCAKKRKQLVPLFPNYLFVRLKLFSEEFSKAKWSPGVNRIISFNGSPAPIDESVVSYLRSQADQNGIIAARSDLKSGQEVRITGGSFDGLLGIIQEPPNAKGRVKILLKLLNRDTHANVPIHCLNGGWVVCGSAANSDAGLRKIALVP